MLIVNLFGVPGAGKSTGAAYVFSQLKMRGVNAEPVTEFAKDKVWEDNQTVLDNQIYVFAKQYFRIKRLQDKVDIIVTDSPILLSSFYAKEDESFPNFDILVTQVANSYDSINAYIDRVKPYNPAGRLQTEEGSDVLVERLDKFLENHGVVCKHYNGDKQGYDRLVEDVIKRIEKGNSYDK